VRDYQTFKKLPSEGNSLEGWWRTKNPLQVFFNYLIMRSNGLVPSLAIRRWLYRRMGMKVGKQVSLGMAHFDIFFPENVELGDYCILGLGSTFLTHEFLADEYRIGKIKVGKRVVIGTNATILCGVEIGDNAVIGAGAVVASNIPPNSLAIGVPAKVIMQDGKKVQDEMQVRMDAVEKRLAKLES